MDIYLIGNAHIDPVWLWRWTEGMQVVRATCQAVLELMERYPDFKFSFSSAIFYKWLKENEPEMFEKIKGYVDEGRWEIVGGWIVEPDCNIPCGESFVRHSLYGQLFFKNNFGKTAKVGYNPDSFGHNASLPQILRKSGMEYYVFMRPSPWEKDLPSYIFHWKSRDGASVLAYRIPFTYATGGGELKDYLERFINELEGKLEKAMFFYGRGDHGGGPTGDNIESLNSLSQNMPQHKFIFAKTEDFFQEAKEGEYPTVEGELQYHSRGCYTSCSLIKALNRRGENILLSAEKFSVLAHLLVGKPYPREEFRFAWENLLFCQFHDILAGSSILPAYEDAQRAIDTSIYMAEKALNYAIQGIARKIKTDRQSIIVFNPSSWRRLEKVEVELAWREEGLRVVSPKGEIQEAQEIQSLSVTGMRRFLFIADVPPLGYAVYELAPSHFKSSQVGEEVPPNRLENDFLLIEVDDEGYISRFVDKVNRIEPLRYPALVPLVIDDKGDAWGHDVESFRDVIGSFRAVEKKWVEIGPIRWQLRVKSVWGDSVLWQDFVLYKDLPFLDVEARLLWNEKHQMLKIALPTAFQDSIATFSIPYGFVEREQDGKEQPLGCWMNLDMNDKSYGVAFINDSKYGGDILGGEMRLSIVRSPVYAHHVPRELEEGKDYIYMDQGYHNFSYRVYPHKGDWRQGEVEKVAEEFNQPLHSIIEHPHSGELPCSFSLLELQPPNVILSALKMGEEEDVIVFRLWESSGEMCQATLEIPHLKVEWNGPLAPSEIKTLKLFPSLKWEESNLLEV
ncbi:alpha-mannosidase [bacterium]|nr:alpha-mannosidase [bacterium]